MLRKNWYILHIYICIFIKNDIEYITFLFWWNLEKILKIIFDIFFVLDNLNLIHKFRQNQHIYVACMFLNNERIN